MKKIVTLTGHKNSNKDWVAEKLAENSDVEFVYPYVGIELPNGIEPHIFMEGYHIVVPRVLEDMKRDEKILYSVEVNGREYVFFEFQMTAPYNVIIVDDYGVLSIKDNWDGELYTVFVKAKGQKPSERVGEFLTPSEFDEVFDADKDDIDELGARIE